MCFPCRCADDMKNIERLTVNAGGGQEREEEGLQQGARPWEKVMDRKNFRVWRRPIVDSPLYEYRGEDHNPPWLS